MTSAECSVEVDAPPEAVWEVTSDPRNLPHWDRHIVAVKVPSSGLHVGSRYDAVMGFMGVRASVPCDVLEWEPPWRAKLHLGGVLNAKVMTSIASLPFCFESGVSPYSTVWETRTSFGRYSDIQALQF